MHLFCCVPTVSDHNAMPVTAITMATTARSDPTRASSTRIHNHANSQHQSGGGDSNQLSQRNGSGKEAATPAVDVKINDIVGNGISGILYKWVNYGKGWRPRWFVLQDGVVSYFKIHGPDKIVVSQEVEKGSKIIGDDSLRLISLHKHSNFNTQLRHKPLGEVHLKVSSIRESKSDDKRFSIFTGTKRLHLRAETREDRGSWMEALQAVKDMFPRMSNSEIMAPVDEVAVSTEKLRQRLMQEGVTEEAIQDTEQIVRSEFASLQDQLVLLKQKQLLLIDTMHQLEVHVMKIRKKVAASRPMRNSSCSVTQMNPNSLIISKHPPV